MRAHWECCIQFSDPFPVQKESRGTGENSAKTSQDRDPEHFAYMKKLSWASWVWLVESGKKKKRQNNNNLQLHERVTKTIEPTTMAVEDDTGKGNSHKLQLEMFRLNFSKISLSGERCREMVGSPSSEFSKTWRDRGTGNLLYMGIVLLQERSWTRDLQRSVPTHTGKVCDY